MTTEEQKDGALDRLVAAYEKMLERVHGAVDRAGERVPSLKQRLEEAREKAVEMEELTREEAERVAGYLERDMQDAATFITETGQQLRDWWHHDLRRMENRMLDMFIGVADQTSVQLREMREDLESREGEYHAGEVAGPGTLVCRGCGRPMHFSQPGRIPPCPGCQGTAFTRDGAGGEQGPG